MFTFSSYYAFYWLRIWIYPFSFVFLAWFVKARAIADRSLPKILAILHAGEFLRDRWFYPYRSSEYNVSSRRSLDRAICLRSQPRSPWHGKCARALIESFVQNRTQLLQAVIQSGTMSSQPDTSLSRNAYGCVHWSRYARSYLATRSEMQIKVSSHNWSSLSTYLSEIRTWTNELSLLTFLSNIDMKYKYWNAR